MPSTDHKYKGEVLIRPPKRMLSVVALASTLAFTANAFADDKVEPSAEKMEQSAETIESSAETVEQSAGSTETLAENTDVATENTETPKTDTEQSLNLDMPASDSDSSADSAPISEAPLASEIDVAGFIESDNHYRDGRGLSKSRNTLQIELQKTLGNVGKLTDVKFNGTFRATYDAVYDLNEDEFGSKAGGAINLEQIGVPAGVLAPGAPAIPAAQVPHGGGLVLPQGDFDNVKNPNEGLEVLGQHLHATDGGVAFGVPVRPCNVDSRGCIKGYLDKDENDLKHPEFNSRADFIREAYVDATLPLANQDNIKFSLGRKQEVWGRSDLFRVLDVINPVDYSRNNIYDELEDIRIPVGMFTAEYQAGATEKFDDLNFQFVWKLEDFRPSDLGQGGSTNAILDAGSFFRGMHNCWENGCTVANFAAGGVATDFAPHTIGIRQANLPNNPVENPELGFKLEGVKGDLNFSVNYFTYFQQLPSLRGGIPADNAFTPEVESQPFDHLIAFDIDFPRIDMLGGSLDYYSEGLDTAFRFEGAYTKGEEFANTIKPRLFSESDVVRWVVGADKNIFIRPLNEHRAFLFSGQLFGQHLLDHERQQGALGEIGMPDHENNYIATGLVKGWFKNDRVSPQLLVAHDFEAKATVLSPSIDWLISDKWRLTAGLNVKTGDGAQKFDDCRSCNPFGPFTATPAHADPLVSGSVGLSGFEPLGRFQAGPIGMAQQEDSLFVNVRYRF